MDVLFLARLQFAVTIMFHYLFPPLTIGLSVMMVVVEGLYLKTNELKYLSIARFWTRLFAVNFALGVATGIVNQFQFGTNWATYSRFVGDVFGTALASEGIFAFFLETGFMGVVVFGWDRVPRAFHFFSTCMVMFGGLFSSIWIVIANSWMQTPAGCTIVGDGEKARANVSDFWAMVFNPSMLDRLFHVWLASFVLGAFFVLSIAAYYAHKNVHRKMAEKMLQLGLVVAWVSCNLIMVSGDSHAREVARYQPAKLAAFEGHFQTGTEPAPLYVIGWPDESSGKVRAGVALPYLLTFLVYHDLETPVSGLDKFPRRDWPPVAPSFLAFHLMVGVGTFLVASSWIGMYLVYRRRLWETRWLPWLLMPGVVAAYIANEAGWVAAEVGRQPWVVQGMLRTSQARSMSVPGSEVLASIVMFSVVYFFLFLLWIYGLKRKIDEGPEDPLTLTSNSGRLLTEQGFVASASQRIAPESSRLLSEPGGGPPSEGLTGPLE